MTLYLVSNLVLYLLFVVSGYWISRKINPPETTRAWILWIILVVFVGGVCVSGYAVNINDAVVLRINDMLQAIGIGILIGFVIANFRQDKPKTI